MYKSITTITVVTCTEQKRRKHDDGKTDLFDEDVCQVWLLQFSEAAHHLLHITGAQVLLYDGHRCRLIAHSFCLAPRGAAIGWAACRASHPTCRG